MHVLPADCVSMFCLHVLHVQLEGCPSCTNLQVQTRGLSVFHAERACLHRPDSHLPGHPTELSCGQYMCTLMYCPSAMPTCTARVAGVTTMSRHVARDLKLAHLSYYYLVH